MALFKNGSFIDDPWRAIADGEGVPAAGHVIFSLDWWNDERQAFEGSNVPLGLRIEAGARIEDFARDIHRFSVIALAFPKFTDGRAFSTAVLLRGRYGYKGELRAVGEVLTDQIQLMRRCGFDAFEINDPVTEAEVRGGFTGGMSHFYQPGFGPEAPSGTRPWARRLA